MMDTVNKINKNNEGVTSSKGSKFAFKSLKVSFFLLYLPLIIFSASYFRSDPSLASPLSSDASYFPPPLTQPESTLSRRTGKQSSDSRELFNQPRQNDDYEDNSDDIAKNHRHPRVIEIILESIIVRDVYGVHENGTSKMVSASNITKNCYYHQPKNLTNASIVEAIPINALLHSGDSSPIEKSWYTPNAYLFLDGSGVDNQRCELMHDWQVGNFVNCNSFHELELIKMRMINKGGSRIAFEMRQILLPQSNNSQQPQQQNVRKNSVSKFVYKTIKYSSEVAVSIVEQQRKDALLMGQRSSSKFIPNLYGYCSVGVLMDFMPEGNMHDYIKGARIAARESQNGNGITKSEKVLSPMDRLKIAIHIATSVADLHGDDDSMPAFFHNDICCHQYLFQDGLFKLNDFNYAKAILVKHGGQSLKEGKELCLRSSFGMSLWKGRSLEEHQKSLKPSDSPGFRPDKIDVWMMGNVIYIILTDRYTFEFPKLLSTKETTIELVAGRRSAYPDHVANSTDPSYAAIKKALDMCWTQDWRDRPSARKVSNYLIGKLREITGEKNPDLRVMLPQRDPDQKPTDSEYTKMAY